MAFFKLVMKIKLPNIIPSNLSACQSRSSDIFGGRVAFTSQPEIANKIALRKEAAKFPSFLIYILVSRNRPLSSLLLPLLSFAAAVATIQTVLLCISHV